MANATPRLLQLIQNGWLLRALHHATQLGLFEPLADTAQSASELARLKGLHGPSVERLLRAFAVHGFVAEHDGRFTLTDDGRMLLAGPHSVAPLLHLTSDETHHRAWSAFGETLKDGQSSARHAFGKDLWAHLAETPASGRVFNQAMRARTEREAVPVARACALEHASRVIDVGGNIGVFMRGILETYPHLTGVIFDLPRLEAEAKQYLAAAGLAGRGEFSAGSFLEGVPAGADVYTIKNVLQDWGDDDAVRILGHVRQASGVGTRLIISEGIMEPSNLPRSSLFDLQMLVMCEGGRVRSLADFEQLFAVTGFALEKAVPVMDMHVIQARAV
jgi:hypothetical protein